MLFKSLYVPSGDLNRPGGNRQYCVVVMREQRGSPGCWAQGGVAGTVFIVSQGEGRHDQGGGCEDSRVGTFNSRRPYGNLSICEYGGVRVKAGLCRSQAERQSEGAEGVHIGIRVHDQYRRLSTLKAD